MHAVKDVNLTIRDKEFMVFVGPSGCGKTTTLRMVAGLEEITSGEIAIGDRVVNDLPPKDRDIAMVFQNYALYPHMSVYDNMAFGLKMRKFPKAEIDEARPGRGRDPRHPGAAQAQAAPALGRPAPARGRRAAPSCATRRCSSSTSRCPTSTPSCACRCASSSSACTSASETTAIYVTHDQVEAMTLGDRVVVMKDGWVQQVGEPMEIYGKPANKFVAGFIGSPAMNFATVTIGESNGSLWAANDGIRIKLPAALGARLKGHASKDVTLGIRPEDLRIALPGDAQELGIEAVVEVVERLGSQILLDVKAGANQMVVAVEPSVRAEAHDRLRLTLDAERLHFFDNQSEEAI